MNVIHLVFQPMFDLARAAEKCDMATAWRVGGVVTQRIANSRQCFESPTFLVCQTPQTYRERVGNVIQVQS